jgi:diacylglycerol kinase (ATP)
MKEFIIGRSKSLIYAFRGAFKLITTEHSIMTQVFLSVIVTIAGFYFSITKIEWMFQIFAIGLILSIEGLNTAIEKIADFVHPSHHEKIGIIKDIAAGAVLFAAFAGISIGLFIYVPHILS